MQKLDMEFMNIGNNEIVVECYSTYWDLILSTGLEAIKNTTYKAYTRKIFKEVRKENNEFLRGMLSLAR
ncbi:hypothetical protein AHAS_Ahas04G0184300 [Arachis hypogaea]